MGLQHSLQDLPNANRVPLTYNRNVESPHTLFHLLMAHLNFALLRFFEVRFSIGDCFGGVDRDSVLERRMPAMVPAGPEEVHEFST